jgi:hypothetical protein
MTASASWLTSCSKKVAQLKSYPSSCIAGFYLKTAIDREGQWRRSSRIVNNELEFAVAHSDNDHVARLEARLRRRGSTRSLSLHVH